MAWSPDELLTRGRWLAVFLAVAACGVFIWAYLGLPRVSEATAPESTPTLAWPDAAEPAVENWNVCYRKSAVVPASRGPLGQRYRLAGTFFAYADAGGAAEHARKAVLDDLSTKQQHLVSEGDQFEDVEVVRIFPDRIVLRSSGKEEELWLSFTGGVGKGSRHRRPGSTAASAPQQVLETSRFGKRVGEARWVLSRDVLMEYYRELLDDPERLASVYLSLKPDYGENGRVAGYYLDTEGEGEFFSAMGLRDGDVIRMVNSMRMTSQSRAEYFIGEFAQGRLSALVLDIEREEEPRKLIFLIR